MLIIIIGLLVYNYYNLLSYTRLHSSAIDHENLSLKLELKSNKPIFFKEIRLGCAKNIIFIFIFLNHN